MSRSICVFNHSYSLLGPFKGFWLFLSVINGGLYFYLPFLIIDHAMIENVLRCLQVFAQITLASNEGLDWALSRWETVGERGTRHSLSCWGYVRAMHNCHPWAWGAQGLLPPYLLGGVHAPSEAGRRKDRCKVWEQDAPLKRCSSEQHSWAVPTWCS